MGNHRAPETQTTRRRIARYAWHPLGHILALIALHVVALAVLGVADNWPIFTVLTTH